MVASLSVLVTDCDPAMTACEWRMGVWWAACDCPRQNATPCHACVEIFCRDLCPLPSHGVCSLGKCHHGGGGRCSQPVHEDLLFCLHAPADATARLCMKDHRRYLVASGTIVPDVGCGVGEQPENKKRPRRNPVTARYDVSSFSDWLSVQIYQFIIVDFLL